MPRALPTYNTTFQAVPRSAQWDLLFFFFLFWRHAASSTNPRCDEVTMYVEMEVEFEGQFATGKQSQGRSCC